MIPAIKLVMVSVSEGLDEAPLRFGYKDTKKICIACKKIRGESCRKRTRGHIIRTKNNCAELQKYFLQRFGS